MLVTVLGIVLGAYEVVVRMIPSVKDYSVLDKIFSFLKVVSDALNRQPK